MAAMLAAVDFAQQRGVAREAPALWFNGALQAKPPRRAWQQLLAYSMQTELPRLQVQCWLEKGLLSYPSPALVLLPGCVLFESLKGLSSP